MLERRAKRRFLLGEPVVLCIRGTVGNLALWGIAENVSETGALLHLDSDIPVGTQVDLTLNLAGRDHTGVQLFSPGKVLRAQHEPNGRTTVAVECTHPLQNLTPAQVA